ncbi:unnamed protein product [Durusdinium trenchii]|uniref:Uncharacterized protein n=2 Tax=Durusdinium trenchii TaxID=1381693 RepID=A0ABP0PSS1_9DINO
MSHEPEEEEEEKSPEEVQLEAEIRAIELDISLMDLRRELEAQEELLERWEEGIRKLKEEKEEAERYHLNTDQDRADERALKAEFRQASCLYWNSCKRTFATQKNPLSLQKMLPKVA